MESVCRFCNTATMCSVTTMAIKHTICLSVSLFFLISLSFFLSFCCFQSVSVSFFVFTFQLLVDHNDTLLLFIVLLLIIMILHWFSLDGDLNCHGFVSPSLTLSLLSRSPNPPLSHFSSSSIIII